jgi:ATP-dependent Clp protease protease subunit
MAKELYLYSPIYDFIAESLIAQMEENKSEDIVIRANTPGGSVFSGWGIIAKMKEHEGTVKMKVDGSVASMGTFCLIFAEEAEALDVSRIHLHRADMYINNPEQQAFLDGVNKDLKAKLTAKIDAAKLKELKGITIDEIFDPEKRLEVWLTAKEAKAIGLIQKIVKLNPAEITAINDYWKIAAENKPEDKPDPTPTNKVMTLEELKAKHPELYAQLVALGVAQERDRVGAWLAFKDIDPEAVAAGIKEGKTMSQTEFAEFTVKALSPEALNKVKKGNAPAVETEEVKDKKEATAEEKEAATLEADIRKRLGLKTQTV